MIDSFSQQMKELPSFCARMFSAENKVVLLGKGRYAVVECFRLNDDNNNAFVAVKKFHNPPYGNNECKILQKLTGSNNVVQLISTVVGLQDGHCIAMEALLGGSLHKHVQQGIGDLHISVVLRLTSELLSALSALEKHGCIHRDIKTSNCVLDHTGRLKLCDFGSSTMGAFCLPKSQLPPCNIVESESKKSNQHRALTITGTTHIMAPEMVAGDVGYDYSVDYWSLGVFVYELLTGHIPEWERLPSEGTKQVDSEGTLVVAWPDDHAKYIARVALSISGGAEEPDETAGSEHVQAADSPKATQYTAEEAEQVVNSWHIATIDPGFSTVAVLGTADGAEHVQVSEFSIQKLPEELALRKSAIDLVHLLLTVDPYKRYSALSVDVVSDGLWSEIIRLHPFFSAVNWESVDSGTAPPAYADFDKRLGCMELLEEFSGANDVISEADQDLFAGF